MGSAVNGVAFSSRPPVSSASFVQPTLFGKTCRVPSAAMGDGISAQSLTHWQTAGRWTFAGESWTHDFSESPNAVVVCSLSQVLEQGPVPSRYWLSPRAAAGILRRAGRRGKTLPTRLMQALEALATGTATHGTATT